MIINVDYRLKTTMNLSNIFIIFKIDTIFHAEAYDGVSDWR